MKLQKLLLLICPLVCCIISADIIPDNSHPVEKCVKITNIADYPDISLLGYVTGPMIEPETYGITAKDCLHKGYKFNTLNILAVKRSYLLNKDIAKVDWSKDRNVVKSNIQIECYGGYMNDSIHISGIEQFYKIVGFTDSSVVLFKWKETNKFNNGKPSSTKKFTYKGDIKKLSQKMK
jgi:hypothetical protein